MFWLVLAFIVMCTVFFKLGALSVIVVIMSAVFKVISLVLLTLSGVLVWRWYRNRLRRRRIIGGHNECDHS